LEAVKKVEKLALLITSEDKSNKQQKTHFFSLTTKPKFSTDLIFHSQQVRGDKNTFQSGCD